MGFTGHEQDDELGLINMRGRMYDPRLGRFITPDPFVTAVYDGQAYNRYAYVLDNPLNGSDPTGLKVWPPCRGNCWMYQSGVNKHAMAPTRGLYYPLPHAAFIERITYRDSTSPTGSRTVMPNGPVKGSGTTGSGSNPGPGGISMSQASLRDNGFIAGGYIGEVTLYPDGSIECDGSNCAAWGITADNQYVEIGYRGDIYKSLNSGGAGEIAQEGPVACGERGITCDMRPTTSRSGWERKLDALAEKHFARSTKFTDKKTGKYLSVAAAGKGTQREFIGFVVQNDKTGALKLDSRLVVGEPGQKRHDLSSYEPEKGWAFVAIVHTHFPAPGEGELSSSDVSHPIPVYMLSPSGTVKVWQPERNSIAGWKREDYK
jgi:RHS repeat-associated protein